jgi:hypothetical protein
MKLVLGSANEAEIVAVLLKRIILELDTELRATHPDFTKETLADDGAKADVRTKSLQSKLENRTFLLKKRVKLLTPPARMRKLKATSSRGVRSGITDTACL